MSLQFDSCCNGGVHAGPETVNRWCPRCKRQGRLVCADDGKTYRNACFANCAKARMLHFGWCQCSAPAAKCQVSSKLASQLRAWLRRCQLCAFTRSAAVLFGSQHLVIFSTSCNCNPMHMWYSIYACCMYMHMCHTLADTKQLLQLLIAHQLEELAVVVNVTCCCLLCCCCRP
jgi:hypothetical protein